MKNSTMCICCQNRYEIWGSRGGEDVMLVFQIVIPCGLAGSPEDGGSMFLQNVGVYLQVHIAYNPDDQQWQLSELDCQLQ
jgi:hypothetical protein